MICLIKIDGLSLPESLMLFLGVLLALIGFLGIILAMIRNKSLANYLYVVALAIVMMGWSGIKKVSIGKDILNIEKKTQELMSQPDNEKLSAELTKEIENIATDKISSPENLTILSKAYTVLGNTNKGADLANMALKIEPGNKDAEQARVLAEANQSINKLVLDPEDTDARLKLTGQVKQLETASEKNVFKSQVIIDAKEILNQPAQNENPEISPSSGSQTETAPANPSTIIPQGERLVNPAQRIEVLRSTEVPQNQQARKYLELSREYREVGDAQLENKYLDSADVILNKQ